MNMEIQLKMYEEENNRMHALVDEFKGKCYRHGVLFKSGVVSQGCPACYFEGELANLRAENEKAVEQARALDANPSTCPHCGGKDWHHTVECYTGQDLRQ